MRHAWPRVAVLSFLLTLLVSGAAWAHVEVSPGEVRPGATGRFTVSVPTEKDVPTTGVRMEVPEGFEVTDVEAPSGWQGELEDGSIVWSGGEIGVGEEEEFAFEARSPRSAGEFTWKTTQTYEDGSVVRWAGPPDSNEPAPVIRVSSGGDTGGETHEHGSHEAAAEPATVPHTGGPAVYAVVGMGVLLLGLALMAWRREG